MARWYIIHAYSGFENKVREQILALRRPGRILVVDEAFADSVPGEPDSLAGDSLPDHKRVRDVP